MRESSLSQHSAHAGRVEGQHVPAPKGLTQRPFLRTRRQYHSVLLPPRAHEGVGGNIWGKRRAHIENSTGPKQLRYKDAEILPPGSFRFPESGTEDVSVYEGVGPASPPCYSNEEGFTPMPAIRTRPGYPAADYSGRAGSPVGQGIPDNSATYLSNPERGAGSDLADPRSTDMDPAGKQREDREVGENVSQTEKEGGGRREVVLLRHRLRILIVRRIPLGCDNLIFGSRLKNHGSCLGCDRHRIITQRVALFVRHNPTQNRNYRA
jgi:hypothetical protein